MRRALLHCLHCPLLDLLAAGPWTLRMVVCSGKWQKTYRTTMACAPTGATGT
jgi:hypothetical protein